MVDVALIGIILFVVFLIMMVVTRFFLKPLFKVFLGLWLLSFIIGSVFIVMLVRDAQELNERFAEGPNLFLLDQDGNLAAGMIFAGEMDGPVAPQFVDDTALLQEQYAAQDYDAMVGDTYYKMFVFDAALFEGFGSLELGEELTLTEEMVFTLLASDDAKGDFAAYLTDQDTPIDVDQTFASDAELKGVLFGLLFQIKSEEQGADFLLGGFKEGLILIHPESIVFRTIKYFPKAVLERFIQQPEVT